VNGRKMNKAPIRGSSATPAERFKTTLKTGSDHVFSAFFQGRHQSGFMNFIIWQKIDNQ